MFDFDLTTTISIFIYTVLSLGCLKYFNYSSIDDETLYHNNEKQKLQELKRLKNEIDFINSDFNIKYAEAMKGEYKKTGEKLT